MSKRASGGKAKCTLRPGKCLRRFREQLGLTLRDVHAASLRLVKEFNQPAFQIQPSRLYDIEAKKVLPNIYRLYALASIYGRSLSELLALYGVPPVPRKKRDPSSAKNLR